MSPQYTQTVQRFTYPIATSPRGTQEYSFEVATSQMDRWCSLSDEMVSKCFGVCLVCLIVPLRVLYATFWHVLGYLVGSQWTQYMSPGGEILMLASQLKSIYIKHGEEWIRYRVPSIDMDAFGEQARHILATLQDPNISYLRYDFASTLHQAISYGLYVPCMWLVCALEMSESEGPKSNQKVDPYVVTICHLLVTCGHSLVG